MYPNFGPMESGTNNKIEIGEENTLVCVLCLEEPVIRKCTGKDNKQKKPRAPSRRRQTKEDFV